MNATAAATTTTSPLDRLSQELTRLQAEAQKRLEGTPVGSLIEKLPAVDGSLQDQLQARLNGAVDAALDRVGLVRKATLATATTTTTTATTATTDSPAADVAEVAGVEPGVTPVVEADATAATVEAQADGVDEADAAPIALGQATLPAVEAPRKKRQR